MRATCWKTWEGGGFSATNINFKTWRPINAGLPDGQFRGRIGIDLCHKKPNVLYAFVDNYELSSQPAPGEGRDSYGRPSSGAIKGAALYRTDDKGET